MADRPRVARYFRHFSKIAAGESPLYAELSARLADNEEIIALTEEITDRQPPANVLYAAVHFLILRGADHPLRDYYHSVGGEQDPDGGEYDAFVDFCRVHRDEMLPLLRKGRVQTNEVRRATFLFPGLAWIASQERRSLATLEVGTAAGLLTLWDLYAYDYGSGRRVGRSELTLTAELRGGVPPLDMPERAWSGGIDLAPVDVDDIDAADWLRAMVWPDQVERLHRLEAAIGVARANPPRLIEGDGIDMVVSVASEPPDEALLVVHHSFALNQVTPEDRARFESRVLEVSRQREVYLLAVEWAGPDHPTELRAGRVFGTEVARKTLARVHHHGAWIDWVA